MIKTVLGFDFGTKFIGVAIGYTSPLMAQPLTTLVMKKNMPPWKEIDALIKDWSPNALIVGVPLNMDGTEQPMTKLAIFFSEALKKHTNLPIFNVDERLTTVEARSRLFSAGGFNALKKKAIDSISAQLIVEMWLENRCYE